MMSDDPEGQSQRGKEYARALDAAEEEYLASRKKGKAAASKSGMKLNLLPQKQSKWEKLKQKWGERRDASAKRKEARRKAAEEEDARRKRSSGMALNLLPKNLVNHVVNEAENDEKAASDPNRFLSILARAKKTYQIVAERIRDSEEKKAFLRAMRGDHDDAHATARQVRWITDMALRAGREQLETQYRMGMLENVGFWKALASVMHKDTRPVFWRAFTPVSVLNVRLKNHGKVIAENSYVASLLRRYKEDLSMGRVPDVAAKDRKQFEKLAKIIRKNKANGTLGEMIIDSHIRKLEKSNAAHFAKVQELVARKHDRIMFKMRRERIR